MSYHTLRVRDNDEEPEETELKVGESRQIGSVMVKREGSDLYVAECGFCNWRVENSPNAVSWLVYCHNRRRIKEGCG